MCGIVGYIGSGSSKKVISEGLSRLEYRGYDSAGFTCITSDTNSLYVKKECGTNEPIKNLSMSIEKDGPVGIGHTRWATHGAVTLNNTHPHFNCKKTLAIVHNGIVEEHTRTRQELINKGHTFTSQTDTEVIAHLLSDSLKKHPNNPKQALIDLVHTIKGAFAFIALSKEYPHMLMVVRHKSPMVIGVGAHENFVASDVLAFADKTSNALFMPDSSIALVTRESVELYSFNGTPLPYTMTPIDQTLLNVEKEGFEHFMLKEIYEQKQAINRTVTSLKQLDTTSNEQTALWRQMGLSVQQVQNLRHLSLIAAGTSWHAARIAQFFFEAVCKIPTRVYLASEFRYMPFFPEENSLFMLISQSGETADTLEAMRLINSFNQHTIAISNVPASSIVREAKGSLLMQAGPEISVASTKAFSAQMAILFWLAHRMAAERKQLSLQQFHYAEEQLLLVAEILESTLETYKFDIATKYAPRYAHYDRFIFLGRHISYPFAMEAALKLKEISYIFSQCYPSGELKHGPIALVDAKTPVVIFSVLDEVIYTKLVANAQEVKARNGHLIIFAFEHQTELIEMADCAFVIPTIHPLLAPLAMTGVMQLFIYYITRELGRPIDKPRNLAKAVTVE